MAKKTDINKTAYTRPVSEILEVELGSGILQASQAGTERLSEDDFVM
jgi:hypothetical protein